MTSPSAKRSDTREFESHRRYLVGVAYRMLGSLDDGEDVVQDAYLRWHGAAPVEEITNPRAYLTRIVVRLCLDRMKSAQARRETYLGPWLPEPIVGDTQVLPPSGPAELAEDLSIALLLTLERLSPLERASFLLHDVFDMDFAEIAQLLDRSEVACRQLAARARSHIREERPRYEPSREERAHLTEAFVHAVQSGDATGLAKMLAENAVFVSDGGGRVPAAIRPVLGRENVSRMLLGVARKLWQHPEFRLFPSIVSGLPGLVFYDETGPFQTLALETNAAGEISAIYVVRNPEKLRHLPPMPPEGQAS